MLLVFLTRRYNVVFMDDDITVNNMTAIPSEI